MLKKFFVVMALLALVCCESGPSEAEKAAAAQQKKLEEEKVRKAAEKEAAAKAIEAEKVLAAKQATKEQVWSLMGLDRSRKAKTPYYKKATGARIRVGDEDDGNFPRVVEATKTQLTFDNGGKKGTCIYGALPPKPSTFSPREGVFIVGLFEGFDEAYKFTECQVVRNLSTMEMAKIALEKAKAEMEDEVGDWEEDMQDDLEGSPLAEGGDSCGEKSYGNLSTGAFSCYDLISRYRAQYGGMTAQAVQSNAPECAHCL